MIICVTESGDVKVLDYMVPEPEVEMMVYDAGWTVIKVDDDNVFEWGEYGWELSDRVEKP